LKAWNYNYIICYSDEKLWNPWSIHELSLLRPDNYLWHLKKLADIRMQCFIGLGLLVSMMPALWQECPTSRAVVG
jgi:hypothetical protein